MTLPILLLAANCLAQKPENVLLVANRASPVSQSIAAYYALKRAIPAANIVHLETAPVEEISRAVFDREIAAPLIRFLRAGKLEEQILYIVTTLGVPLKIAGGGGRTGDQASVDSELTLLYSAMKGKTQPLAGSVPNPFFGQRDAPFTHAQYPIYLVTRLAAYDLEDVKKMIDRSLAAVNRGNIVLDLSDAKDEGGNGWLRTAAILLPPARVKLEETSKVVYGERDVIGYASWGSNDSNRKERQLRFTWLPGAIMTEYVSSNGRTFERPPDSWTFSTFSKLDAPKWWKGSPQSLTADYIHEGATGASGHVYEPYLSYCPRPEHLFPAYLSGRTLAESYYLAIPALSWMNIVVGDPLCRLAQAK